MAIFNITNKNDGSGTVVVPPPGSFEISTLESERCNDPQLYQAVDNVAYRDPNDDSISGYIVYSDVGLTTLYNTTGVQKDYNINNGLFITLDANSVHKSNPC